MCGLCKVGESCGARMFLLPVFLFLFQLCVVCVACSVFIDVF